MEMIIGSDMEMSSFGIGMTPILFSFFGLPEFPATLVFSIQFSLLKVDPCRKLAEQLWTGTKKQPHSEMRQSV